MYPTKPISKLMSAAGFTAGLALATTTMSASVVLPTDDAASPQATVATEQQAPSSSSNLIHAIAGSDIGLTARSDHQFTHFSDLFVGSDDRVAGGGGLSETVTAALFGGGATASGRLPHRAGRFMPALNRARGLGLVPRRTGHGFGNGNGFGGGGGGGGIIDPGDDPGDGDGGMFDDEFHAGDETIQGGSGDSGGGSDAAALPFPPAVWIGLVGLASVGLMRRCAGTRRSTAGDSFEAQ